MVRRTSRFASVRRGLTLIELVVVMLILAALAGIILPMFPSMMQRAHSSTSATNLAEITKSVETYRQLYLAYPNNLDSLVDASGNFVNYVVGARSTDDSTDFGGATPTALTLTDDTAAALNEAGLTTMAQMVASTVGGDFSPTFYPYGANSQLPPTTTALVSGTQVAQISGAAAAREFGSPATALYAAFGIGKFSSMQGKTMQEAPVHFGEGAADSPSASYARYLVVFQLTEADGTTPLEQAQMIGIAATHSDGIANIGEHLAEYWAAK